MFYESFYRLLSQLFILNEQVFGVIHVTRSLKFEFLIKNY